MPPVKTAHMMDNDMGSVLWFMTLMPDI